MAAVGDAVYTRAWVRDDEDPGPGPHVALVQDTRPGQCLLRFLYRPTQARRNRGNVFYCQEVLWTSETAWVDDASLCGRCAVLSLKDYLAKTGIELLRKKKGREQRRRNKKKKKKKKEKKKKKRRV